MTIRRLILGAVAFAAFSCDALLAQHDLAGEVRAAAAARRPAPADRPAEDAPDGGDIVLVVASKDSGLRVAGRHVRMGVADRGANGGAASPGWIRDAWTDGEGRALFRDVPEGRVLAYVTSPADAPALVADPDQHPLEPQAFGGAPLPWTTVPVDTASRGAATARLSVVRATEAAGELTGAGGMPLDDTTEHLAWIAAPGSLQLRALDGDGRFAWQDPRPATEADLVDDPAAPSPALLGRVLAGTLSSGGPHAGSVDGVPAPRRGSMLYLELGRGVKRNGADVALEPQRRRPIQRLPRGEAGDVRSSPEDALRRLDAAKRLVSSLASNRTKSPLDDAQAKAVAALERALRARLFDESGPAPPPPRYPDLERRTSQRRLALRTSPPSEELHRLTEEPTGVADALRDLRTNAESAPHARRALQRWIDAIAPFEPSYAAALAERHPDLARPRRLRRSPPPPAPLDPVEARALSDEVAGSVLDDLSSAGRTDRPWAAPLVVLAHLDPNALERFVAEARAKQLDLGDAIAVVAAAALVIDAESRALPAAERWSHLDLRGLDLGVEPRSSASRDPRAP